MITEEEYSKLVQECLILLRKQQLGDIADKLQSIINKPIIDEPAPERKCSKDISEAKERPRTSKEQLQAIIAFLEARLVHPAKAVSRTAELTRHDPGSIKWMGGEDAEGWDFSAGELSVDIQSLAEIQKHLHALRQAADMPSELN
ncbi:MAG: hypothetical protein AB7I98_08135 [Verrucomicrobiales bacterium]